MVFGKSVVFGNSTDRYIIRITLTVDFAQYKKQVGV